MAKKKYTFDFFQCEVLKKKASMKEIFSIFKKRVDSVDQKPFRNIKGKKLEIRFLEEVESGFRGVIGKYRKTDLPHAAVPGGEERELDLEEDEHLLEKAYFHYFYENNIIILQRNRNVLSYGDFSKYLSVDDYIVSLNPIIEYADLKKLMNNEVNIRAISMIVARPTNIKLFRELTHDFSNTIFQSLNNSNASKVNLILRGDSHSTDPEKRYIKSKLKHAILEIKDRFNLKKAVIDLEDSGGTTEPIDLILDRLVYIDNIELEGAYPFPSDMWNALNKAKTEKESEIINYFGAITERLE